MIAKIGNRLIKSIETKSKDYDIRDDEVTGFMIRVYKSGRASYVVEYARGKRQTIGNLHSIKPAVARQIAKDTITDYAKGIDPAQRRNQMRSNTLSDFLENLYGPDYLATHKSAQKSLSRIKSSFAPFLKKSLPEITVEKLNAWKTKRLQVDGVSKSTVNRDIEAIKAALQAAWKQYRVIDHNPLADLKKFKLDNSRVRYLSEDEEKRLIIALSNREARKQEKRESHNKWLKKRDLPLQPELTSNDYADHLTPLVLLAMNTGARRGELFSLLWDDIDLEMNIMTIRAAAAKSGQTRHIPLNRIASDALKKWKNQNSDNGLVFPGKEGEKLDNIKRSWEGLLALAEIEGFTFHDLRHHFASKLVMAGVDLNTVRELLGHADLKMTLRYAHLAPKAKADAVKKICSGAAP